LVNQLFDKSIKPAGGKMGIWTFSLRFSR